MSNARVVAKRASSVRRSGDGAKMREELNEEKAKAKKLSPVASPPTRQSTHKTTTLAPVRSKTKLYPSRRESTQTTAMTTLKTTTTTKGSVKRSVTGDAGWAQRSSRPSPRPSKTSVGVREDLPLVPDANVPIVEDLERDDELSLLSGVAGSSARQHLKERLKKTTVGKGGFLSGGELTDTTKVGGNGNGKGRGEDSLKGIETAKKASGGRGTTTMAVLKGSPKVNSEEEDEEDDDEEEEDEEDDDDEEDGEEEEDDEEEDGSADSDGDDEDESDESDDEAAVRGERGAEEQITVKVSREGDRNVKVIYITRSTKFKRFARDIMRRFGYAQLGDFDMYCIDAAGDHVDIDISKDFRRLIARFLETLRRERESNAAAKATVAPQVPELTRRFSARGTLRGSASLSRTHRSSDGVGSHLTEGDRSSSTVLRLYVRDSYAARQQGEQRGVHTSSLSSGTQRPLQAPGPLPSPKLLNVGGSLAGGSSIDFIGRDNDDILMNGASAYSLPLDQTGHFLSMTIGFREDEDVQWSKMGLLGKGSFGSVYEGITSEGKIMAVKVMDIPINENVEELKGIQREINLMRSLKHKNIVAYYGCQTKDLANGMRQLEIFLEHCHGGSLSHLRRKFDRAKERFCISLVRTYTRQILEGLNYLHSMNVVHRDLKSDNVLISALGEAKLADFGCSKRLGTATMNQMEGDAPGAGYQTVVGTPFFMAPEVLSCDGSYTKAADVWSVGCLILEMLGRQPWTFKSDANAFQIMYHISRSTTMPTGVPTRCPATLLNFFTRCFEHDPGKRATAAELLAHEWITCPDSRLQEVLDEENSA